MPYNPNTWWTTEINNTNDQWCNNQFYQQQYYTVYQEKEPIKIEVSEEDRTAIINKLKEMKARNGDSAFFPAYCIEQYQELARQNIIKSIDNKSFYLEENE